MENRIILEFPDEECLKVFWGWWEDGGGWEMFSDLVEHRLKIPLDGVDFDKYGQDKVIRFYR